MRKTTEDVDWPGVIRALTEAAVEGGVVLAEAGMRAARQMGGADGALLVRWSEGHPDVVARTGDANLTFDRRLPEGAGHLAATPVAVVSVDPRTDLVVCGRDRPFDDTEVTSLRTLTELMSWAAGRHTTDLALLGGLAARVVASLDLDEVLTAVADAGSRLARAEIAGVFLATPSGEEVQIRAVVGNRTGDTAQLVIPRGEGLAGRVLATGRPQRVEDYTTDPRMDQQFLALADAEGTCSALAVPLVRGRDRATTGVLVAWRRRRTPFTDEDEHILSALAELAAAAAHNARAHADLVSGAAADRALRISVEERLRAAEQDLAVYTELTRIAIEGDDLGAVMRSAGSLTGASVAMAGDGGRLLAAWERPGIEELPARLTTWAERPPPASDDGESWELAPEEERRRWWMLVVPVRAVGLSFGFLGLGLPAPPTPGDRLAAEQAAAVAGLLLAREEATVAARRSLASDFVWDLLDGRLADLADVIVRARHLGAGFALPARVAALQISGLDRRAPAESWTAEELARARARLGRLVGEALGEAGVRGAVLAHRADTFAVVVPGPSAHPLDPRRLARLLAGVPWPEGITGAVGVGGSVDEVAGFPEGWQQARLALSGALAPGAPGVFEDLGVLQFLLAPASRAELDGYARLQLGALLAYDAETGSELVSTLETYLAEGCSTRKAAERLLVHHRTVSYRLGRVEELTELRLDQPEDRFHAQLALKILALPGHAPESR